MLDELAPAYQQFGYVRERMGADTVNVVPHSHYLTKDARWIAIACSSDEMFARLANAMGRPELAEVGRFGRKQSRLVDRDRVNNLVADWVKSLTRDEVLERCRAAQVPVGPLYSIAEIFEDLQYVHRKTIVTKDSRLGPLAVPGVLPNMSDTPGEIRWLGPALGAHTDAVLAELLGLGADDLVILRSEGVI
jgi:crotonobetainyl-CoA:carnitine CoA-transferase CaiB-like acyl-CoA transferase